MVGQAWERIADRDIVGLEGTLVGVIAGGPGAIAWGSVDGAGPRIWTSTNGRDWVPATVEAPADLDNFRQLGSLSDVTSGGPGYVAVGSYGTRDSSGAPVAGLIWTSTDGTLWRRVATGPSFADSMVDQVVNLDGELLAFGSGPLTGVQVAPTVVWASDDGVAWSRHAPSAPKGALPLLPGIAASASTLWASGFVGTGLMLDDPQAPQPPRLTSLDGLTWTRATPPVISYSEQLHPLPGGLYLTVTEAGWPTGAAWMTRSIGVFRSTDLRTWAPLAVGKPLGDEIIEVADTLVMVGTGAWRSTDGGSTWQSVAVSGGLPPGATTTTMASAAALPDGTIVAVGADHASEMDTTAVWVSSPQR